MKKLQVMLEDDLMAELKIFSIRQNKSLKDVVTEAVSSIIEMPTKEAKQPESKQPKPRKEIPKKQTAPKPNPHTEYNDIFGQTPKKEEKPKQNLDESIYYILRKTARTGKPLKQMAQYQQGTVTWLVLEGCKAHYDADGNPIPFRFTDGNGQLFEPDEDELKELEEYYGKPVIIEE